MWNSSNPMLTRQDTFNEVYGKGMNSVAGTGGAIAARPNVTTMQGVLNKTTLLVGLTVIAGGFGYSISATMPSILWMSAIAGFVICLGMCFLLAGKPQLSPIVGPIYAIVEGIFLGAFTALADDILAAKGLAVAGGVGVQAFIITAACMVSMLGLYSAGIIRPTKTFMAVVGTATLAIGLSYLAIFVLRMFGVSVPYIGLSAATTDTGTAGWIGLGINAFILVIASLTLAIDFKQVEDNVAAKAPKYMEWYCAVGLLVTLAWIYFESVKMVLRVATMFGSRD